jgi:membrane fusion protein (multidrug efflux system)
MRRQALDIKDRTILSPVDGVIDTTFVNEGEYVRPGQRLMLIHDPSQIWVKANIRETELRYVKIGAPVEISVDAFPDRIFKGEVFRIGNTTTSEFSLLPSPNPSGNFTKITQRLPVRIKVTQDGELLRPGMMVEIDIVIPEEG